ncbi:hypothetical protein QVD17_09372 [Tagetes erecta]|uniref:Uncharacterized protein n=1 Tax=Tagetes erecta TaxID=13708 RepID=A0AAD8L774_TARER|nr:hypothetical protein QVD17_09372 [Tagetes erecta]
MNQHEANIMTCISFFQELELDCEGINSEASWTERLRAETKGYIYRVIGGGGGESPAAGITAATTATTATSEPSTQTPPTVYVLSISSSMMTLATVMALSDRGDGETSVS